MASQNEDRIRARAHQLWEAEGRPHGRDREHWEQAAREIENETGTSSTDRPASAGAEPVGPAQPGGAGGIASGLQPGGVRPGGGPAATQGSVGTSGGSTAGKPSGSVSGTQR